MDLQPGFSKQTYEVENGLFSVKFAVVANEPNKFFQWIQGGDLGICIDQIIDLNTLTWDRTLYYQGCRELADKWEWNFPEGEGNYFENDDLPVFHEESYDDGFADGYGEGYDQGVIDTTPEPEYGDFIETELLDQYVEDFNDWVNK